MSGLTDCTAAWDAAPRDRPGKQVATHVSVGEAGCTDKFAGGGAAAQLPIPLAVLLALTVTAFGVFAASLPGANMHNFPPV